MSKRATITFEVGQIVRWIAVPDKFAQVVELRRSKVRLAYRSRSGRWRFPIVDAVDLDLMQDPRDPLLPLYNPLGRGIARRRAKAFEV